MSPFVLHDRLTMFLLNLECLDTTGQRDAFINEVMETDGDYDVPNMADSSASHFVELSLHNIVAYGTSEEEALNNWKHIARKSLDHLVEDDGDITIHPPVFGRHDFSAEIAKTIAAHEHTETGGSVK